MTLPLLFACFNCLGGRGILPGGRFLFRCLLPSLALWQSGLDPRLALACLACFSLWFFWGTGPGFATITRRDAREDTLLSNLASRLCGFGPANLTPREAARFGTAYLVLRGLTLLPLFLLLANLTPGAIPLGILACLSEAAAFRLIGLLGEREQSVARAELLTGVLHGGYLAIILAITEG